MSKPIVEMKVKTGTAAAAVTGYVLSVLSTYVFHGDTPDALAQILTQVLGTVIPAAITFGTAWLTRHTDRVDIEAEKPQE